MCVCYLLPTDCSAEHVFVTLACHLSVIIAKYTSFVFKVLTMLLLNTIGYFSQTMCF